MKTPKAEGTGSHRVGCAIYLMSLMDSVCACNRDRIENYFRNQKDIVQAPSNHLLIAAGEKS